MSETVGAWRERKYAQALRFLHRLPDLWCSDWCDYRTKFVLVIGEEEAYQDSLVIGQLPSNGSTGFKPQPGIDLTDEQIEKWIARHEQGCVAPV